jgi:hypothetical protein
MADEAKEFSKEEAQSLMFHGAPQQPMTAPAVQSASNIPVPPPVAVIPGAKKAPVAKEPDAMGLVQKVSKANKELQGSIEGPKPPSSIGGLVDDITANWKPIAIGALTFATGYGAARLLGGRKSAEVSEGKPQPKGPAARIEPTFATPEETAAFKPVEQPTAPSKLALESEAKFGVPLSDVENHFNVKISNIKDAEILSNNYKNSLPGAVSNQPAGIPGTVSPMNQLTGVATPPAPIANAVPPQPVVNARNQAAEFRARQLNPVPPPPPPPPSISNTVASGGNVTQAVNQTIADLIDQPPQELRTGTGKPAYAGQGPAAEIRTKGKKAGEPMLRNIYAKIEDVPAGYAFVPGAQNIDTSRTNIGQTEYTKAYTNRPFPLTNDLAMQESSEINRLLGRPTREEAKAAGLTLPPQTPGITKHVLETKGTPFMGTKAAKVGGILGALIAIPDLAKAETAGQRGMAGANMLEAVLPPGFTMMGAGESSTLPANILQQQNAAMLLGSPYAQSDIAKKRRADEQYARQVGGGRGIAPPSVYKR